MGKGLVAVLVLVALAIVAVGIFLFGVSQEDKGEVRPLGLSFGAALILITFVFFLAMYSARIRMRGSYAF